MVCFFEFLLHICICNKSVSLVACSFYSATKTFVRNFGLDKIGFCRYANIFNLGNKTWIQVHYGAVSLKKRQQLKKAEETMGGDKGTGLLSPTETP